jgi:endonuclease-3 related protein
MGQQHWWPAGSAFEVVVGAYLTQNTAWKNVELAMQNLRDAGVLSVSGIRNTPLEKLELLVRPAGYFRQKAARLKHFVAHLDAGYGDSLDAMFAEPTDALREELLGLPGIGPETADSILLYAANREVFVVDTYTRRIFGRHRLAEDDTAYDEIRLAVQEALAREADAEREETRQEAPNCNIERQVDNQGQKQGQQPHPSKRSLDGAPAPDPAPHPYGPVVAPATHAPTAASQMERSELSRRYNEFHALIVQTAKHFCVKGTPKCESCPLRELLPPKSHSR